MKTLLTVSLRAPAVSYILPEIAMKARAVARKSQPVAAKIEELAAKWWTSAANTQAVAPNTGAGARKLQGNPPMTQAVAAMAKKTTLTIQTKAKTAISIEKTSFPIFLLNH